MNCSRSASSVSSKKPFKPCFLKHYRDQTAMPAKDNNSRLVYSSELGRVCPKCRQARNSCRCKQQTAPDPGNGDGIIRIQRQTKGRKGKGVTLICGIPLAGDELKKLAKSLKQKCGTGGTIKNGVIEIQGEHRDLLLTELQKQGWKVKIAGG